jgi:hypothetical protein
MANFRFINEAGQDDTGRVATYLQKSLPIAVADDLSVTINPICYVNTFVFEGAQSTNAMIVNIAAQHNLKSSKGDYLELIFAPTDSLEIYLSFANVGATLSAEQRFVAYFQYDGVNWLYTNPPSSGGGPGPTPALDAVLGAGRQSNKPIILTDENGSSAVATIQYGGFKSSAIGVECSLIPYGLTMNFANGKNIVLWYPNGIPAPNNSMEFRFPVATTGVYLVSKQSGLDGYTGTVNTGTQTLTFDNGVLMTVT